MDGPSTSKSTDWKNLPSTSRAGSSQIRTPYKSSTHPVRVFEVLDSLRKDEILCDIKLETNDGTVVFGHKVILASSCPYFRTIFTSSDETNKNHVKVSLPDFNRLRLNDVKNVKNVKKGKNNTQSAERAFEILKSLRKDKVFCDVKLETDDGTILSGHKVILASGSPYFRAMFTSFKEGDEDHVFIKELDPIVVMNLVDFIYTSQITVTEENVQSLLVAAVFFQMDDVKRACGDLLQTQLRPTHFLNIMSLAKLYDCTELQSSSEAYIIEHFTEVVESNEFPSLSFDQLVKLISSDDLNILSEEKVFECVVRWVKHDLSGRKDLLPKLMEHVRLPFTTGDYIINTVVKEPLIKESPECRPYIKEALNYHLLKSQQKAHTIPDTIRTLPRQYVGLSKDILLVGSLTTLTTEWFDSSIQMWRFGPPLKFQRSAAGVALYKHHILLVGGSSRQVTLASFEKLELFPTHSQWHALLPMDEQREFLGVATHNNIIYAIGGFDGNGVLNSAESFGTTIIRWVKLANMSARRMRVGVGVLNNNLYAVGGNDESQCLKSVECYHILNDRWTPVADMNVARWGPGVGVVNGVLYAVGGWDGRTYCKSVEAYRPDTGVWTFVADMHVCREAPGVVVLDGFLYAIGGKNSTGALYSIEMYDPKTNTWSMMSIALNIGRYSFGITVLDKPLVFAEMVNE